MLGQFATASRRTPPVLILHCHSPGVATIDTTTKTRRAEASYSYSAGNVQHLVNGNVKSMSTTTTTTTTTRDRGDRYGPIEWAQSTERHSL